MLRVLIAISVLMLGVSVNADNSQYKEPTKDDMNTQRDIVSQAINDATALTRNDDFGKYLKSEKMKISDSALALNPNYNLPNYFNQERNDRYATKAFDAGKSLTSNGVGGKEISIPFVLVSFSMSDDQIVSLMDEAHKIGAGVAVRGLIDNDMRKTIGKLRRLAGTAKNSGRGVVIDPTLFIRFNVTTVPTFILPLEKIKPCDDAGCPPVSFVKASGSVSFDYFLDLIKRTGDDNEKSIAARWMANNVN